MRRRTGWVVAAFVLFGAIVYAGASPQYALGKELRAARREGLWTTPEEIRQGLSVPDERNAALPIRKAVFDESDHPLRVGTPKGTNTDGLPIMQWKELRDPPVPLPAERRARLA